MDRVCADLGDQEDGFVSAASHRVLENTEWWFLKGKFGGLRSRIATVVGVPLTSNLKWADGPGNVLLPARSTILPKDSVANVSQIVALDKSFLTERMGEVSAAKVDLLLSGIDAVLGRWRTLQHAPNGDNRRRSALQLDYGSDWRLRVSNPLSLVCASDDFSRLQMRSLACCSSSCESPHQPLIWRKSTKPVAAAECFSLVQ